MDVSLSLTACCDTFTDFSPGPQVNFCIVSPKVQEPMIGAKLVSGLDFSTESCANTIDEVTVSAISEYSVRIAFDLICMLIIAIVPIGGLTWKEKNLLPEDSRTVSLRQVLELLAKPAPALTFSLYMGILERLEVCPAWAPEKLQPTAIQ